MAARIYYTARAAEYVLPARKNIITITYPLSLLTTHFCATLIRPTRDVYYTQNIRASIFQIICCARSLWRRARTYGGAVMRLLRTRNMRVVHICASAYACAGAAQKEYTYHMMMHTHEPDAAFNINEH